MSGKGKEPGHVGRVSKGTSVELQHLNDYQELVEAGELNLRWSDFVNQALEHELARYKREARRRKP